jgi:hypothetical protein
MADSLHLALSAFRDTMLTAVAKLEFAIRDGSVGIVSALPTEQVTTIDSALTKKVEWLETSLKTLHESHEATRIVIMSDIGLLKNDITTFISAQRAQEKEQKDTINSTVQSLQEQIAALLKATEETKELLKIPAPSPLTTRNVLINTPALSAAVAALPSMMVLDDDSASEKDVVQLAQTQDVEMSVEGEVVDEEEKDEDDGPDLRQVMIKGKQYFMDAENSVYVETDEGYEEIGTYNPILDCIEGAEEADEEDDEAEEEEAVEVEEFIYKGKTYQRDNENNVYEDGDHIGTWNGKRIVPLA